MVALCQHHNATIIAQREELAAKVALCCCLAKPLLVKRVLDLEACHRDDAAARPSRRLNILPVLSCRKRVEPRTARSERYSLYRGLT
jgi:hypothetical protein